MAVTRFPRSRRTYSIYLRINISYFLVTFRKTYFGKKYQIQNKNVEYEKFNTIYSLGYDIPSLLLYKYFFAMISTLE